MLSACAIERAHVAQQAQDKLVGMSKEQILTCMGAPENKMIEGKTESWTYNSGGGLAARSNENVDSRYCKINIVMIDGKVSRVNYSGATGGLITQGEQCAYAVSNCMN